MSLAYAKLRPAAPAQMGVQRHGRLVEWVFDCLWYGGGNAGDYRITQLSEDACQDGRSIILASEWIVFVNFVWFSIELNEKNRLAYQALSLS